MAEHISADLLTPHFTISEWEAVGRRLRANYLWIFVLLSPVMDAKDLIHPGPIRSTPKRKGGCSGISFWTGQTVGLAPGWVVVLFGAIFNLTIFFIAFSTLKLKDASSEVLPLEDLNGSVEAGVRLG